MVCDHVDEVTRTFKVVAPCFECLKDSEEFFVVDNVVKFGTQKGVGMESNQVDLAAQEAHQQDHR